MFTLMHAQDGYDRRTLVVEEVGENDLSRWSLKLTTRDIPINFEQSRYKAIDLAILPESKINVEEKNIFLIPVKVRTIIRGENTSRLFVCHADNKQLSSQLVTVSPELILDCYVTIDNDRVMDYITNPYLKIEFGFSSDENNLTDRTDLTSAIRIINGDNPSYQDQVAVANADKTTTLLHTSVNENANGGLDIPLSKTKIDQSQEDRESILTP